MTIAGTSVALDPDGIVFDGDGTGRATCAIDDLLVNFKSVTSGDMAILLSATIQSSGAGNYGRYWNTNGSDTGIPIGAFADSSSGSGFWYGSNGWDSISYDSGPVYPMDVDLALVRSDSGTTPVSTVYARENSGTLKTQLSDRAGAAECEVEDINFQIGNRGSNNRQLDGLVKWFGVLNYAPDSTEIDSIFSAGRPPAP